MFDRREYMKSYDANKYSRRKSEGRCTMCGNPLTDDCKTLLCEPCREKQKQRGKKYWLNQKRKLFAELKKKYTEEGK